MTVTTNANREALLPPTEDLEELPRYRGLGDWAQIEGTGHKSPELVYHNRLSPLSLSVNQELQIWYGQDWADFSEDTNSGQTCVDVFVWHI